MMMKHETNKKNEQQQEKSTVVTKHEIYWFYDNSIVYITFMLIWSRYWPKRFYFWYDQYASIYMYGKIQYIFVNGNVRNNYQRCWNTPIRILTIKLTFKNILVENGTCY